MVLDLTAASVELTRALCDMPSVSGDEKPLADAIAGHIDTVPINDNVPTKDIEIDGVAHLWGRGTVDMKSGTAVQLKLAAELTEPSVDITWMWYDNEEVEASKNGLALLAAVRPDLFQADFAI